MFRAVLILAFAAMGLVHPTYSSSLGAKDSVGPSLGWTSQSQMIRFQIEKNFALKGSIQKRELHRMIQHAMNEANPKHEGVSIAEMNRLAREIVSSAQCLGIDPIILTALIWRESNFKPTAQSETGAVGLTQMTNPGIKEVLDRLSPTSHRRLGYLRSLVGRCNSGFLARVPGEVSADTLAAWKNSVAYSNTDAVMMGALLLKLNLASTKPHSSISNGIEVYMSALEHYNGDPVIKERFAKDVLLLSRRMMEPPTVALNNSKFLRMNPGL